MKVGLGLSTDNTTIVTDSEGNPITTGPYATTPTYTKQGDTITTNNSYISYLLSSGSWIGSSPVHSATVESNGKLLKKGNYQETISDKADVQLMQDAIWCSELNKGNKLATPQSAMDLLNEANAYEQISGQLTGNYEAKFLNTNPKVIANQKNGTYTIGPYMINYPNDRRFSYIQDISIVTDNGNTITPIVIAEYSHNDGYYPKSNESFFLQFNANDIGDSSSVNVKVEFGYLKSTSAKYETYTGKGEIYQCIAYYVLTNDSHEVQYKDTEKDPKTGKDIEFTATETCIKAIYNGYVRNLQLGTYDAQNLILVIEASRTWSEKIITTDNSLDLRMSLGGYVWEDLNGGKESIANGLMDKEELKVPNVIVTLYTSNGDKIGTTITDEDGFYIFNNLDAMKKYYVTFTYNGQYYEPTTYAPSNTWGSENWKINSNATDKIAEREAYNNKFETIGSSPANYVVGNSARQTYSKNELLGKTLDSNGNYVQTKYAVTDEFGNLLFKDNNPAVKTTEGNMVLVNSLKAEDQREVNDRIQFVKDCQITAHTGNDTSYDIYPYPSLFTINDAKLNPWLTADIQNAQPLYPNAYYINLGLHPRQEADLAVKKDIEKVTLEINGQRQEYTYNTLENKPNADGTWDINIRLSDSYYNANYSREIHTSDYVYKVTNYGADFEKYGKTKADELEVYVTYKIMIRNQSLSIQMRMNELVDYFDEDYDYIDSRSYIQFTSGGERKSVNAQNNSIYGKSTETTIPGYNKIYIEGLNGEYLSGGQTAYIYLTFKVKKDSKNGEFWLKLDENYKTGALDGFGVGKENIVEINGYSTRYAENTQVPNIGNVGYKPAGIIDKDSKPGNLNPNDVPKDGAIKYENFEDDTDKAPNLRLRLFRDDSANRVISGVVWEDERNETIGVTSTGDGKRDNEEKTRINGVTVQLVELMENGTEYIWRTFEQGSGTASKTSPIINYDGIVSDYIFEENHNGQYAFKSFMPGKYIIRFIYGDTERTVTPSSLNMGGLNEKSYNGQDYKSTTYQQDITQNRTYEWRKASSWQLGVEKPGEVLTKVSTFKSDASNNETTKATLNEAQQKGYLYDITASDKANNVSDAKDIESRRNEVIKYSNNSVTNYIAEVLASHKADYDPMNDRTQLLKDLMQNTKMTAETGLMVIEVEKDTTGTADQTVDNKSTYHIENVDLGLEERPKAQIAIDKKVTNVKLTLANGSILFDAKDTASNVLWRKHKEYEAIYQNNQMDPDKFGNIVNIRNKNKNKFGIVQLTLDEELMHGATIEITYQVTVSNIGEVDYYNKYNNVISCDRGFYYTGNKSSSAQVVTTTANQVIDYVANNLQFSKNSNKYWNLIPLQDSEGTKGLISQGLINKDLESEAEKYNTIIITEDLNKELVPSLYKDKVNSSAQDSISVPLVLSQLITSENDSDDLNYRNIVEIVKTSNTLGRRNEYSVVGNQNPTNEPQELDSDRAEAVRILPPFGNAGIYIIIAILVIVVVGIITGSIIFIKKKVLTK